MSSVNRLTLPVKTTYTTTMENLRHYLIDWLNERGYNALDELAEYDIRVTRDERYPNLFNLKYGTIMADKANPLVCACRGAVVERVDNDGDHSPYYRLVAYAFDRFFNIGEGHCHELDWSRTKVYEKFSGSLIKLFEYRGQWLVSTSGSVAGDGLVGKTEKTFDELFWDVFEKVGYLKECLDPSICYIFELCHLDNKDVINYDASKLPLLAVRDRDRDFEECDLEEFGWYGYVVAPSYEFSDLDSVLTKVEKRDSNHEGYVLFDGVGRVKIKSRLYCQLHRAWNNGEPDFSELFLNDDLDEFLLHFPEYRDKFSIYLDSAIPAMQSLCELMLLKYGALTQKEFAIAILKDAPSVSAACFAIRSGRYPTFRQWLADLRPQQLDKLLGIR
jgi:hypothetical protein